MLSSCFAAHYLSSSPYHCIGDNSFYIYPTLENFCQRSTLSSVSVVVRFSNSILKQLFEDNLLPRLYKALRYKYR